MSHFLPLLRRFGKDESGVFAVLFGLLAIVLIALGGATVDYVSLQQARQRAQMAVDAAVLALQPNIFQTGANAEDIRQRAEAMVLERIGDINLVEAKLDRVTLDLDAGRLFLGGELTMPTIFVNLVGVSQLSTSFEAEAVRGSVDIEVAVALDITGSMGGSRLTALKAAVGELVDVIVQDVQEPTYSKVALVPYSQAVNAGSYAAALRGPERGPKTISSMSWATGATKTITAATRASPVEITSNGHGLATNDWVYVFDVQGMSQINNRAFQISRVNNNRFTLRNVDGRNYGTFTSGKFVKCHVADCATVFTSNNHGYSNNDWVRITDVATWQLGNGINNTDYRVINATANTLQLSGYTTNHTATYTANSGRLHCTWQTATEACSYLRYNGVWGTYTYPLTNCVTERAAPINDRAPSVTYAGRNYVPNGICPTPPIVPLTDNRATLHSTINSLPASGNTAGSVGILWTWYMLSPNFGYVWPELSRPAPYRQANLLKAAIIMTDGEFNTVHCNGAVSSESAGGWDRINCPSPNGGWYKQSEDYCDAMKDNGIVIYTVGFGITAGSAAANVLNYCASDASNAYLAANASDLSDAFEQIARNISALRLSR
jgi:Flp pilus assembly protein TadG